MRLLLISNSTNAGEKYLDYPKHNIKEFLGDKIKKTLFIPYAGVTMTFDEYAQKVQSRFDEIGLEVDAIHNHKDPIEAVRQADAIVVGGGNTFHLTNLLHKNGLVDAIREKVASGTPFIGWSAGSNIACPTICTTNDMPIIQPPTFEVLNLVPFQINPHYLDANPDGHAGETREMRLEEFMEVNKDITIVGLREGTMLLVEDKKMKLIGVRPARIFKYGETPIELTTDDCFTHLLG